jgi:hypothetical protein
MRRHGQADEALLGFINGCRYARCPDLLRGRHADSNLMDPFSLVAWL